MKYELVEEFKKQYIESKKWYSVRWHYIESCILKAYMDSFKENGKIEYYKFVKNFIDKLYDEKDNITFINTKYHSADQIRMASILFDLYEKEKDYKYKKAMDVLYSQLESYPRTPSKSFWHKENYPNQIWLDGLYMIQPFYARYIKEFETNNKYFDIINQFSNARKFMFDEKKKLYYHAYDESKEMFWADKLTGLSPNVWGRAVGWMAMALVDVLELIQDEDDNSDELKSMLQELVDGMVLYQDNEGMWYQVVDKVGETYNYLETSGTLMMSYSILKAVRLGYLSKEYITYGKSAFDGTIKRYLRKVDGEVLLGGICRSAGLGRNPDTGIVRDGSYEYYTKSEKIVENNGHGAAPLIMAYNEIELCQVVDSVNIRK